MNHNVKLFNLKDQRKQQKHTINAQFWFNTDRLSRIPDYQTRAITKRLLFGKHSGKRLSSKQAKNSLNVHTQPVRLIPNSKQDIKSGQSRLSLHCFLVLRQGNSKHKSKNKYEYRFCPISALNQPCKSVETVYFQL